MLSGVAGSSKTHTEQRYRGTAKRLTHSTSVVAMATDQERTVNHGLIEPEFGQVLSGDLRVMELRGGVCIQSEGE